MNIYVVMAEQDYETWALKAFHSENDAIQFVNMYSVESKRRSDGINYHYEKIELIYSI